MVRQPTTSRAPRRRVVARTRVAQPLTQSRGRMGLRMGQLDCTRCWRLSNQNYTVAGWSGSKAFRLSDLPNATEFTALFDCYRIYKVETTFIPKYNVSDYSSGGSAYGLPTLYIVSDENSTANPASINELCQYKNCVFKRFDQPVKYTVYPKVSLTTSGGTGQIVDNNMNNKWIRSAYPDVDHNGIMWGLDMPVGLGDFKVDVCFKYFLKLKDTF